MKALGHGLRVALLVVAIGAGATAWLFAKAPERLRAWEARAVAGATLEDVSEDATPAQIERFLSRHADVMRGDRAYGAVRCARIARVSALLREGRTKDATEAALALARHDPRDLAARLWAGQTLVGQGADRSAGLDLLRGAFRELPEHGVTTRTLFDALGTLGRTEEALGIVLQHLACSPRSALSAEGFADPWTLYWRSDADEGFADERSMSERPVVTDAYVALTFHVPSGASELRFDPAGGARVQAERTIVALVLDSGPRQVDLDAQLVGQDAMVVDAQTFRVEGSEDPRFTVALPEEAQHTTFDVRLVIGAFREPRWIERALSSCDAATFERAVATLMGLGAAEGVIDAASGVERARAIRARGESR